MAETKLNKARQPKQKRAAGPVGAIVRLEQEHTRRKRADRLRDAEISISPGILTILDSLPFYVMLIDERHHILLANKAVRDQLQVSPEEILGQYYPQAIHGLKGPFPGCPLEEAVAVGKGIERELYDERYGRWVNSAVYPTDLKTRDGKDVFYHMTFDITDRKHAEERHKESEQRFKAIFNSASNSIVLADTKSQKFYIGNKMMSRMLGYSQEEIKKLGVLDIHPRKDLPYVIEQFEKQARNEITLAEDIPVQRKDGSVFYADVSSAQIILGGRTYLLGIFRDITERKKVADEQKQTLEVLKETLSALTQSNKELERFAYVASHDLQEPLRMVASYSQLLARRYKGKLDKDADEFIGYAVDGAVRMQRMINDLLAYSRVGTRGKQFTLTNSKTVLKQATDNLRLAITESGAVISHGPLPEVMADEWQLVQLLQNLIGNAIKFRGSKPPHVRISAEERENDWLFSVADNGIGIDPADAERIFLVFQHLHGNKFPGTGIGLAICKKIAARHGGRIWVESVLGKGATFYFIISRVLEVQTYELKTGNIQVTAKLSPDLPWTLVDEGQIQQVLLNIITNAEQSMRMNKRKGRLSVTSQNQGGKIVISIADNGKGIAAENLEKIFEPFFTTKEPGEGTGLGLSISYSIIREHGGRLHARSNPGRGTTFFIELPVVAEPRQLKLAESSPAESPEANGGKILVVDDEPDICRLISRLLAREGYEVEITLNARQALEKLSAKRYRLILVDIKMPDISGIEFYRRVGKIARSIQKRIVFITGDTISTETGAFLQKTGPPISINPSE